MQAFLALCSRFYHVVIGFQAPDGRRVADNTIKLYVPVFFRPCARWLLRQGIINRHHNVILGLAAIVLRRYAAMTETKVHKTAFKSSVKIQIKSRCLYQARLNTRVTGWFRSMFSILLFGNALRFALALINTQCLNAPELFFQRGFNGFNPAFVFADDKQAAVFPRHCVHGLITYRRGFSFWAGSSTKSTQSVAPNRMTSYTASGHIIQCTLAEGHAAKAGFSFHV